MRVGHPFLLVYVSFVFRNDIHRASVVGLLFNRTNSWGVASLSTTLLYLIAAVGIIPLTIVPNPPTGVEREIEIFDLLQLIC